MQAKLVLVVVVAVLSLATAETPSSLSATFEALNFQWEATHEASFKSQMVSQTCRDKNATDATDPMMMQIQKDMKKAATGCKAPPCPGPSNCDCTNVFPPAMVANYTARCTALNGDFCYMDVSAHVSGSILGQAFDTTYSVKNDDVVCVPKECTDAERQELLGEMMAMALADIPPGFSFSGTISLCAGKYVAHGAATSARANLVGLTALAAVLLAYFKN